MEGGAERRADTGELDLEPGDGRRAWLGVGRPAFERGTQSGHPGRRKHCAAAAETVGEARYRPEIPVFGRLPQCIDLLAGIDEEQLNEFARTRPVPLAQRQEVGEGGQVERLEGRRPVIGGVHRVAHLLKGFRGNLPAHNAGVRHRARLGKSASVGWWVQ